MILNCVVQNGGDAAILIAIIKQVKEVFGQDVNITACDMHPEAANSNYPDLATFIPDPIAIVNDEKNRYLRKLKLWFTPWIFGLRSSKMFRWTNKIFPSKNPQIEALLNADLILSTGGTYLVDHYDLRPRFFAFDLVRRTKSPLILYTQSMGPFAEETLKRKLRKVLGKATKIYLRDKRSQKYLQNVLPTQPPSEVCHDIVFCLDGPESEIPLGIRPRPRVIVSVREWSKYTNRTPEEGRSIYQTSIAAAVTLLVEEREADVLFVSTCQGRDGYRFDDSKEAKEVIALLSPSVREHVSVNSEANRPSELLDILKMADFVVATRMHMAILSLVSKLAVFAVAYEFKTKELFEGIGHGNCVQDIDTVVPETFANDVLVAFDNRDSLKQITLSVLPSLKESSEQPMKTLRNVKKNLQAKN